MNSKQSNFRSKQIWPEFFKQTFPKGYESFFKSSNCLSDMFLPSLEAVRIAIQLLSKFKEDEGVEKAMKINYVYLTSDGFLQEHFEQHDYSDELEDEVAELFFKVCKFRKYLKVVEKLFLNGNSPCSNGNSYESSVNIVLLYLLIIELNEVSKTQILQLLMTLDEKRVLFMLALLNKSETIIKLYELACQIWDVEYVKEVLANVLKSELLEDAYTTATNNGRKIKKREKKQLTVPIGPKCLSYPKRFVPPPPQEICSSPRTTRIPVMIKASQVPNSTYVKPIQLEEIEKARKKNREEAQRKYLEAQRNAFKCANPEKSQKFEKFSMKIEKERFGIPAKKPSRSKMTTGEVPCPKKTAAVILREGARLLKLEQEEIKRYEDLACGGFNNDLIIEWEKEIREETYRKHIEDIEKKHLEGLLSYEEALIAKQKCLMKKKEGAAEFRKEKENWVNQLEIWRKEEQIRIQESFEKGKSYEKGAKEAVEHVKEEKHKIALETMEESRILKEKWLKEKEQDLQRKVQLIKEIKALQALGVVRKKETDFTETANLGFLTEMSLAELKERLYLLKIEVKDELERRRARVKIKRECRKEIIDTYQDLIETHKKILQEQKQKTESDVVVEEMKCKTKLMNSSSLVSLRRKLYEKRCERIKQQIMC